VPTISVPHTFISEKPHSRNHEWLTSFTPVQRRQLIDEDIHAENGNSNGYGERNGIGIIIRADRISDCALDVLLAQVERLENDAIVMHLAGLILAAFQLSSLRPGRSSCLF